MSHVRITAVGAITPIGTSAAQTDASIRAGLSRFHAGPWPADDPATLSVVRDDVLADAIAAQSRTPLPNAWCSRIAALAGLALADAVASTREPTRPIALMLGLPDAREGVALPGARALWAAISAVSGCTVDDARSHGFPRGRAAIFDALAAGCELALREPATLVVVGAVDSWVDEARVAKEHAAARTAGGEYACDGRALGEAAGMLVLESAADRRGGLAITGLARIDDPGHRFGHEPARGEGLANAIEALRASAEPVRPFASVWAGLAGEAHDTKLWGIACLRHRDLLRAATRVEHPADRLADAGAGLGAMLFVDAHQRLLASRRDPPTLVWAASDHGPIGCAALELDGGSR